MTAWKTSVSPTFANAGTKPLMEALLKAGISTSFTAWVMVGAWARGVKKGSSRDAVLSWRDTTEAAGVSADKRWLACSRRGPA